MRRLVSRIRLFAALFQLTSWATRSRLGGSPLLHHLTVGTERARCQLPLRSPVRSFAPRAPPSIAVLSVPLRFLCRRRSYTGEAAAACESMRRKMEASSIRGAFTAFFERHDHLQVASAPLVAPGDPFLERG